MKEGWMRGREQAGGWEMAGGGDQVCLDLQRQLDLSGTAAAAAVKNVPHYSPRRAKETAQGH